MPYNPGIQYVGDRHLAQGFENLGRGLAERRIRRAAEEEAAKVEAEQLKSAETTGKAMETLMSEMPEAFGGDEAVQRYLRQARALGPAQKAQFLGALTAHAGAAQVAAAKAKQEQQKQANEAAFARTMQQLGSFQQGAGRGVLAPEVQNRYARLLEDPSTARAASVYGAVRDPYVAERMLRTAGGGAATQQTVLPTGDVAVTHGNQMVLSRRDAANPGEYERLMAIVNDSKQSEEVKRQARARMDYLVGKGRIGVDTGTGSGLEVDAALELMAIINDPQQPAPLRQQAQARLAQMQGGAAANSPNAEAANPAVAPAANAVPGGINLNDLNY